MATNESDSDPDLAPKLRDSSIPRPVEAKSLRSMTAAERWTPELKAEKREWAKRGIADGTLGLFGTAEAARMANHNRKRMLETVADVAAERGQEIADELTKMLRSASHRKKIDAIDRFTRIAESAAKNEREHERELRAMTPDQLRSLALERLIAQYGSEEVIDGHATEMQEGEIQMRPNQPAPLEPSPVLSPDLHPDDNGTVVGGDELRRMAAERLADEYDPDDA